MRKKNNDEEKLKYILGYCFISKFTEMKPKLYQIIILKYFRNINSTHELSNIHWIHYL